LLPKRKRVPLCRQFFYVLSKAKGGRLYLCIAITSAHSIPHTNTTSNAHTDTASANAFANPFTDTLAVSIAFMQHW